MGVPLHFITATILVLLFYKKGRTNITQYYGNLGLFRNVDWFNYEVFNFLVTFFPSLRDTFAFV